MGAPDVQTPGGNPASTNPNTDAPILADTSFRGNPGDRIEAIKAQLAQRGYTLHLLHDGSFFVAGVNLVKPLPDLRALVNFARQIGAAA